MNIPAGQITDAARRVLIDAGGHIATSKKAGVLLAVLPKGSTILWDGGAGSLIEITGPTGPNVLVFRRAWQTEGCTLDLCL